MNYQGPYYKNRNDNTYMKKLSTQLLAVLIIMLLLLILKFVNNDITSKLSSKVKESFYKDYTKETVEIFNNFAPNTKEVFNKLISKKSEFMIDSMPVYGSIINSTDKDNSYSIKIKTTEKAEVKAVYDGRVERVENDEETGISIIINHGNGFESRYGFLSDIKVSEGEDVTKGSIIGLSGKDKNSENCIIFALLKNGEPVNVEEYLKK
ncbi:Peptidase family M23 [Caloramator quimbayensis]|uniref:Peptidase family M23 n=1 Tax=Caloramator quimbayensis TaxID=1147123 RepID=A0A1T4XZD4_9CLOT|nr:M23 family metallopeptidase [Caloramator quimbayensis]SKA94578.1 Peptidase family M23 [Caloramator quimbayensis]